VKKDEGSLYGGEEEKSASWGKGGWGKVGGGEEESVSGGERAERSVSEDYVVDHKLPPVPLSQLVVTCGFGEVCGGDFVF